MEMVSVVFFAYLSQHFTQSITAKKAAQHFVTLVLHKSSLIPNAVVLH